MIQQQAQQYLQWQQSQSAIDLLKHFRDQSALQRDLLTARALNQLADGKEPATVLTELANKLTNSLIHAPTKALKKAAHEQDESSLALLQEALGIEIKQHPPEH